MMKSRQIATRSTIFYASPIQRNIWLSLESFMKETSRQQARVERENATFFVDLECLKS